MKGTRGAGRAGVRGDDTLKGAKAEPTLRLKVETTRDVQKKPKKKNNNKEFFFFI